ncbi:hypothetical protein NL676_005715 [Syzygium grande]|nr:hypothetical protein NL676_005715 [Syzygium grande]
MDELNMRFYFAAGGFREAVDSDERSVSNGANQSILAASMLLLLRRLPPLRAVTADKYQPRKSPLHIQMNS